MKNKETLEEMIVKVHIQKQRMINLIENLDMLFGIGEDNEELNSKDNGDIQ